jgi:hypothetical protein
MSSMHPLPHRAQTPAAVLASCIMPTADRRAFVPGAIARFLSQDYGPRELVILDDGEDAVADLVPAHPSVRYLRTPRHRNLGAKRNAACEAARGDIILHWDDDDWYSPERIRLQIAALDASRADVCGVDRALFLDPRARAAWEYVYPHSATPWVCGASLCYRREVWHRNRFADLDSGEDTRFVAALEPDRVHRLADNRFFVALLHPGNSSPKRVQEPRWRPRDFEAVRALTGSDWPPSAEAARAVRYPPVNVRALQADGHEPTVVRGRGGLSVVLPFGGAERLGQLAATLAALRACSGVDQLIVAEVGAQPLALETAQRSDADYVFIGSEGAFDKARAFNTGSRLAWNETLVWCDADLLVHEDFLARAQQEFASSGYDFMIAYSRIEYLDEQSSLEVRAGRLRPAQGRLRRTIHARAGSTDGGICLLRAGFLRRHGGMVEGFRGWGGEDNAWVHKVSVLGRVGLTRLRDQVAWHLHHEDQGLAPWRTNPAYARNCQLLAEIRNIADPHEFARRFPAPRHATPPWPPETRIVFVVFSPLPASSAMMQAGEWARQAEAAFGSSVPVVQVDAAQLSAESAAQADILVAFFDAPSACEKLAALLAGRRAVLVPLDTAEDGASALTLLAADAWLLPRTSEQMRRWRSLGLPAWHRPWGEGEFAESTFLTLVQPLSHLISGQRIPRAPLTTPPPTVDCSNVAVPVWTYWEGPMPEWIARCLETQRRHIPGLRLLAPPDFDALWDRDRDINLARLHVAQRADFIRAFLLMRFGGLWIDADCIVMRNLEPLLERLDAAEVIAHRERQGLYSNAFLAIRPNSALAQRFYATVCGRLRTRSALGWIALGNEPLSEELGRSGESLLELPTEDVQPVCWSRAEAFFRLGDELSHQRVFSPRAWCYMLSHQRVLHHLRTNRSADLLAPRSFFSYLLRRALRHPAAAPARPPIPCPASPQAERAPTPLDVRAPTDLIRTFSRMCADHIAQGHESASGPGSSLIQTAEIRRRLPHLLQHLHARSLLDAPCGDFHWMAAVDLGIDSYLGIDLLAEQIRRNAERYGGPGRAFRTSNLLSDPLPRADVVLCRDCLGHFTTAQVRSALRNFVASGSNYLLATTFPGRRSNPEIATGDWRPLNLQAAPFNLPAPLLFIEERCSEGNGAFKDKSLGLWRLADLDTRAWRPGSR